MKSRHYIWLLPILLLAACGESATVPANGTIYGTLVYVDGSPASSMIVKVEETGMTTVTDANGEFIMNGLLAVDETGMGRYYTIRGYGEHLAKSVGFLVTKFKVKGQQSYGLGTVVVQRTGSISGIIYLEDADDDHSGVRVAIAGTSLETITRADGSFLLKDIPAFDGYVIPCTKDGYMEKGIDRMIENFQFVPIRVEAEQDTQLGASVMKLFPDM